jgi:hypothetical protein
MTLTTLGWRLTLFRHEHPVWQSSHAFRVAAGPHTVNGAALRGRLLAFSTYGGGLWIARVPAFERAVARHEEPVAWTRNDELVTQRVSRSLDAVDALLLRRADGTLVRRIAGRKSATRYVFDPGTATLLTIRDGRLLRTDGRRRDILARVRGEPSIEPLRDARIGLVAPRRITVLDRTGRLVASTRYAGELSSELGVAPGDAAVAFATLRGRTERVELLRPGARRASVVFRHRVRGALGERRGCRVEWSGRWLLYTEWDGTLVALDPAARRSLDLSDVVRRLPEAGRDVGLVAFWARWG